MDRSEFIKIVEQAEWIPWVVFYLWDKTTMAEFKKNPSYLGYLYKSGGIEQIKHIEFHFQQSLDLTFMNALRETERIEKYRFITEISIQYVIFHHIESLDDEETQTYSCRYGTRLKNNQTIQDGITYVISTFPKSNPALKLVIDGVVMITNFKSTVRAAKNLPVGEIPDIVAEIIKAGHEDIEEKSFDFYMFH